MNDRVDFYFLSNPYHLVFEDSYPVSWTSIELEWEYRQCTEDAHIQNSLT